MRCGPTSKDVAVVEDVYSLDSRQVRRISALDMRSKSRHELLATDEHLFWVDGKGWTAAQYLQSGNWLMNAGDGRLTLLANTPLKEPMRVYTLRLARDHAFYAEGILVHDLCGNPFPPSPVQKVEVSR